VDRPSRAVITTVHVLVLAAGLTGIVAAAISLDYFRLIVILLLLVIWFKVEGFDV
jgi:hypothetical protein